MCWWFFSRRRAASFRQLIKITGIGARTALGILSGLSSDDLQQAIAQQDVSRLTSIPGIGKKPPTTGVGAQRQSCQPLV